MKRFFILLFCLYVVAVSAVTSFAADTKGSALPSPAGGVSANDKMYVIDVSAGPASTSATVSEVVGAANAAGLMGQYIDWNETSGGKSIANKPAIGTSAGNLVQLDGNGRLPAVDGSQLTNLPGGLSGTNLVDDTSPQLGGNLDTNGFSITGLAAVSAGVSGADLSDTGVFRGANNVDLLTAEANPTGTDIVAVKVGTNNHVYIGGVDSTTWPVLGSGSIPGLTMPLVASVNPQVVYNNDPTNHALVLDPYTSSAQTITALRVQCDVLPATEPTVTFYYTAAGVGYGSPTTIHVVTTTSGVANITSGITHAAVPSGSKIYVVLSDPDNAILQMSIKVELDKD